MGSKNSTPQRIHVYQKHHQSSSYNRNHHPVNTRPTAPNSFSYNISCQGNVDIGIQRCIRCNNLHSPFTTCPNPTPVPPVSNVPQKPLTGFVSLCPNSIHGCTEQETYAHSIVCPYKLAVCVVGAHLGECYWKGALCKMNDHIKNAHPNNIIYKLNTESVARNIFDRFNKWEVQIINHMSHTFIFHLKVVESWLYSAVQLLGSSKEAEDWCYSVAFYTRNVKKKRIFIQEQCTSYTRDLQSVFLSQDCVTLPVHVMRNYISKYQGLTFAIRIFKCTKQQNKPSND